MADSPKTHSLQRSNSLLRTITPDAQNVTPKSTDQDEEVAPAGGISRLIKEYGHGTAFHMILGGLGALGNGASMPAFLLFFKDLVNVGTDTEEVDYKEEGLTIMISFIGVGFGFLIFNALQYVCWGILGAKISVRVREQYFRNLLRQDVGYYDEKNSGAINTELISDCLNIAGMGTAIGLAMQHSVTFIGSFVLAF